MSTKKVAVVTGANKGIGFAIVRGLCKRFDGDIYLTSRNVERGHTAVENLKPDCPALKYHQLDITDNQSLNTFHDFIQKTHGGIDILVNNAGIAFGDNASEPPSVQAEQMTFVNYTSLVNASKIIFPIMNNGARIVNVASSMGHLSYIPNEALRKKFLDPSLTIEGLSELMQQHINDVKAGTHASVWGNSSYAVSKVGVIALTRIQQRMLNDRDIKVNAVHPGYVDTDMSSHKGLLSPDQGAEAPLFLALDAPDSLRGQLVWFDKRVVDWDGDRPSDKFATVKAFVKQTLFRGLF